MRKKRLFSILLSAVMIMTMIPAFSLTVSAASDVSVSNSNELKAALTSSDTCNITVTKDITVETAEELTIWCTINGNKTLDLQGHKVEYKNTTNNYRPDPPSGHLYSVENMFKIASGATLTVKDSTAAKAGKLFCNGVIDDNMGAIIVRNVVLVDKGATLNLESGHIATGRYTSHYDTSYSKTVTAHIWGTGVMVRGGNFNMSGGSVEGSGYFTGNFSMKTIDCAAIYSTAAGSNIEISGGNITGYNGASAIKGPGNFNIYGGRFLTTGTDNSIIEGPIYTAKAAPTGVNNEMLGSRGKVIKGNKTDVFTSTDLEIGELDKLEVTSATTTADANKNGLKYNSLIPLTVQVTGGEAPYQYSWQIKRIGADRTFYSFATTAQASYNVGTADDGASIRCKITDKRGNTVFTDEIALSVFYRTPIYKIALNIEAPAAGKSPSYTASSATANVKAGTVVWEKYTTKFEEMKSGEKFEAGKKYRVTIYVNETDYDKYYISPASISERDGYTINGKTVTAHTLNQEVDRSLIMEFTVEAAADPGTTDPGTTDPGTTDPGTTDPGQVDPGTTDPGEDTYVFPFVDVKSTDWFYESVKGAHKMHLIDGMDKTHFAPDSNMTYAQAIKLAACMNQLYKDGKVTLANGAEQWYSTYVDYCLYNGIIGERYSSVINNPIDRQHYAAIFAKALPAKALTTKNTILDGEIPDVSSDNPYYKEIYKLYRAGICNGSDSKGTFNPNNNIKRSEVAAILIRMMDPSVRVDAPADL